MFKKKLQFLFCVILFKCLDAVPPTASTDNAVQDDLNNLKYITKALAVQLEKWNNLFLTTLEPRMSSTGTILASIDTNVNNLQERAHVWDTFQLHVSAWNDQLSSLDRKVDIISKGQEKVFSLEAKINSFTNIEYKIENLSKSLEKVQENVLKLTEDKVSAQIHQNHDVLFGEFATRGILSTIKQVEKKLDRLLLSQHNSIIKIKSNEEKPKLTIKCNVPKPIEELLNDVSSKVDVIFDKISNKEESEYDVEEYVDDGSGGEATAQEFRQDYDNNLIKKVVKKMNKPCKRINQSIEELLGATERLENVSRVVLDKQNINNENFARIEQNLTENINCNKNINNNEIVESYLKEQRAHFESLLKKYLINYAKNVCIMPNQSVIPKPSIFELINEKPALLTEPTQTQKIEETIFATTESNSVYEPNTLSCEDLDDDQKSGIYVFGNSTSSYNKRFCLIREDGIWTVIQRRDYYSTPENFNISWNNYKSGFGNLQKDFWFGNDFIHLLNKENNLTLRVELEDFDGNFVWAEFSTFKILSESENYQLIVSGYTGNATDSFSSHNGSLFSTFDRKNDQAPACCPCSESYGGGWWFNSCFDSNLNGLYYKKPHTNTYFKGIIWEHWLGNYSLKKTLMMVKPKTHEDVLETTTIALDDKTTQWPYFEDP